MNDEPKLPELDSLAENETVSGPKSSLLEEETKFKVVSEDIFIEQRNKLPLYLFAYLTPYSTEEYREMKTILYLSEDNASGFGIREDGELTSVFSLKKERGVILVKKAKELGGKHLSCIGNKLLELYSSFGFKLTKELTWDDSYAPKHWDYNKFGRPKIYEMSL